MDTFSFALSPLLSCFVLFCFSPLGGQEQLLSWVTGLERRTEVWCWVYGMPTHQWGTYWALLYQPILHKVLALLGEQRERERGEGEGRKGGREERRGEN